MDTLVPPSANVLSVDVTGVVVEYTVPLSVSEAPPFDVTVAPSVAVVEVIEVAVDALRVGAPALVVAEAVGALEVRK